MTTTDLRRVVEGILRKWGHNILLQRVNTIHDGDEPDYVYNLERHTTRHMYPGGRGLPGIAKEEIEGVAYDAEMIYYFMWDVNPASGDRIYEELERYPDLQNVWKIDFALPMRGAGGRIEYWVVGASREVPN